MVSVRRRMGLSAGAPIKTCPNSSSVARITTRQTGVKRRCFTFHVNREQQFGQGIRCGITGAAHFKACGGPSQWGSHGELSGRERPDILWRVSRGMMCNR